MFREKKLPALAVAAAVAVMLFGCSKGYESQKTVDDLTIALYAGEGRQRPEYKMEDSAGKTVTDAAVNVRYYMPPMPGMAPMDFSTQAVLKGGGFFFSVNVPMEGGWKAEVSVMRPGKPVMATFNLDAR